MTEVTALAPSPAAVPPGAEVDADYWLSLIDEKAAANFLKVTTRTMQSFRQRGGGARFLRLSARCIRYTRADLRAWAEEHVRYSTADTGSEDTG